LLHTRSLYCVRDCYQGVIVDVRCPEADEEDERSARYICVDPVRLAQLVIATLVDDDGRRCFVRVDAERFWPTHLGWTRPTPRVIVNAIDDIAKLGVIHEALFPVLWQVCFTRTEWHEALRCVARILKWQGPDQVTSEASDL